MIIFHEGLPRSGKSYEAMVFHIVPALKAGRPVQAYIEGLDFEKIASVCELPLERVQELLTQITVDQVKQVPDWAKLNSLVVIDEAQDFWPTQRQPLPDDVTKFVTQHGHKGIDILLMGQDLRDVHNLWRRRVDMKIVFMKRDMIGKDQTYKYTVYKARKTDRDTVFEEISNGVREYDKKYFGTYLSHVDNTVQTGNYKDDRANLFKTKAFRFWLPLALVLGIVAIGYLIYMFKGDGLAKSVYTGPSSSSSSSVTSGPRLIQPVTPLAPPVPASAPGSAPAPVQTAVAAASSSSAPRRQDDYIAEISDKWRPRLSAYMKKRDGVYVLVEWFDGSMRKMESLKADQIAEFGYTLDIRAEVLILAKADGTVTQRITAWPIDPFGMVNQQRQDSISAQSRATEIQPSSGPAFSSIARLNGPSAGK